MNALTPILADGDWFQLLAALLFLIISAAAQWLQKRGRGTPDLETTEDAPPPLHEFPRSTPTPPPRPVESPEAWEAQLRRLLDPAAPLRPEGPPKVDRGPVAPPNAGTEWLVEDAPGWESADAPSRPLATFSGAARAHTQAVDAEAHATAHVATAAALGSANAAVDRGARLSDRVGAQLRSTLAATESPDARRPSPVVRLPTSRPASRYGTLFRNQESARHAFVASLVFGPPKGLD